MNWYVTLIKNTATSGAFFNAYRAALENTDGVVITENTQDAQSQACTLIIEDPKAALDRAFLLDIAATCDVDAYVARTPPRKRKLLVADMEATIILDEMIDVLAEKRGLGSEIQAITARAMAGELDFAESLIARTKRLAGTPESLLIDLCQHIHFAPGAQTLVKTMGAAGAKTALVTGGYGIFAQTVARHCGFDMVVANNPVIKDGAMTGALQDPICTAKTKRDVLLETCATLQITPDQACCVGDGANDIEMLKSCGLPASYKGKPAVREIVNLNIENSDLTAVLYAQGYKQSDFVTL